MIKREIAIVGAGASGLIAAIAASGLDTNVTIYESNPSVGKKILMTGNGRCNLTNANLDSEHYNQKNEEKVGRILSAFGLKDTLEFFSEIGIEPKMIGDLYYPYSLQAKSVKECLERAAMEQGVSFMTQTRITSVEKKKDHFILYANETTYQTDALILCTGGMSYPKTGSDGNGYDLAKHFGHTIEMPLPALTGVVIHKDPLTKAHGVRIDTALTTYIFDQVVSSERGELQITDYGLSGIAMMNLSNEITRSVAMHRDCYVRLDFLPDTEEHDLIEYLKKRFQRTPKLDLRRSLIGLFPDKLIPVFCKKAKLSEKLLCEKIKYKDIAHLVSEIKFYMVEVEQMRDFTQAQTTDGGVLLEEIEIPTMESKLVKDLYMAGEMIDVTGFCGGYNLQWAWSSGYLAGRAAGGDRL